MIQVKPQVRGWFHFCVFTLCVMFVIFVLVPLSHYGHPAPPPKYHRNSLDELYATAAILMLTYLYEMFFVVLGVAISVILFKRIVLTQKKFEYDLKQQQGKKVTVIPWLCVDHEALVDVACAQGWKVDYQDEEELVLTRA